MDPTNDLCHVHSHTGVNFCDRISFQNEGRTLVLLNVMRVQVFTLQEGYDNRIANITIVNKRMAEKFEKSKQQVSVLEIENAELK